MPLSRNAVAPVPGFFGIAPERIVELDWRETHRVPRTGLSLTAAPSQHFSGRGLKNANRTAWSSFVVEFANHEVFFRGDTGLTQERRDPPSPGPLSIPP